MSRSTSTPIERRAGKLLAVASTLLCLLTVFGPATAQPAYPSRSVEIVVGFPAGSAPDMVARTIGNKLKDELGQPVVVKNLPGASGNLAAAAVAKSSPDGHTLLLAGNASLVVNQHLFDNMGYDPVRDLAPVSRVVVTPNLLVVPPELPAKTLAEFVSLARSRPEGLTYAHVGIGTSQHLAGVFLENLAGVSLTPVPYKGGPAIYPDLLSGRVSACFCNIGTALPLVRDSKLRALAVTSLKRSPSAPEIPTLAEAGFAEADTSAWFGLMLPGGTPTAIVDRLHRALQEAMVAEMRKSFEELGMIVALDGSPAEFAKTIETESNYWQRVLKAKGIKAQ